MVANQTDFHVLKYLLIAVASYCATRRGENSGDFVLRAFERSGDESGNGGNGGGSGHGRSGGGKDGEEEGSYRSEEGSAHRVMPYVVLHGNTRPNLSYGGVPSVHDGKKGLVKGSLQGNRSSQALPARRMIDMELLRAKMCRQTDSCIWEFDHFCPWVGNAVGRRNYRSFVAFLTVVCALNLALLASTTIRLMHYLAAAQPSSIRTEKHKFGFGGVIAAFQGCTVASLLLVLALIACFRSARTEELLLFC